MQKSMSRVNLWMLLVMMGCWWVGVAQTEYCSYGSVCAGQPVTSFWDHNIDFCCPTTHNTPQLIDNITCSCEGTALPASDCSCDNCGSSILLGANQVATLFTQSCVPLIQNAYISTFDISSIVGRGSDFRVFTRDVQGLSNTSNPNYYPDASATGSTDCVWTDGLPSWSLVADTSTVFATVVCDSPSGCPLLYNIAGGCDLLWPFGPSSSPSAPIVPYISYQWADQNFCGLCGGGSHFFVCVNAADQAVDDGVCTLLYGPAPVIPCNTPPCAHSSSSSTGSSATFVSVTSSLATGCGALLASFIDDFNVPQGLAVDRSGNMYIADSENSRVVVLSSDGSHLHSFTDNVYNPTGVAVDGSGNVYVAEGANNQVVVLAANGTLLHIFTHGFDFSAGVAVDGSGNIFVADTYGHRVAKLSATGVLLQSFTAGINDPVGIALDDSGNIYVVTLSSSAPSVAVVALSSNGTLLHSFEISNSLDLSGAPLLYGVAVDNSGNIYVAESNPLNKGPGDHLVVLSPSYSQLHYFYDGFSTLSGIAVDASGDVYVTDIGCNCVSKLAGIATCPGPSSSSLSSSFSVSSSTRQSSSAALPSPVTSSHHSSSALSSSTGSSSVVLSSRVTMSESSSSPPSSSVSSSLRFSSSVAATSSTTSSQSQSPFVPSSIPFPSPSPALSSSSASSTGVHLNSTLYNTSFSPWDVTCDASGYLYISEATANQIVKITTAGRLVANFSFSLNSPRGLAIDSQGALYVADNGNARIVKFASDGTQLAVFTTVNPGLSQPADVAIDSFNNLWIADAANGRVVQLYPNGTQGVVLTTSDITLNYPAGVEVDASNAIYVVDTFNSRVVKFNDPLSYFTFYDDLYYPTDIAVDGKNNIFIVDSANNRVIMLSVGGSVLHIFTTSSPALNYPTGISVDSTTNIVYVADYYNSRVVSFNATTVPVPVSSPASLSMVRLQPSYSFNNRTGLFLAVLPSPLQYYAVGDSTLYTSAPNPIIQFHSYTWWPSTGGGSEFNDTYLIDANAVTSTTVPVILISGSNVETYGYNETTQTAKWGSTVHANPLNGNSPSLDCIGSVGCSSRTTGILYLFGCFSVPSMQHRYSMDGGKTWNNSGVDLQLFGPNQLWGIADPRCEVDPVSGEVILFSGLRYAYAYASDLINTVWVNPGGGEPTTDPSQWTIRCSSAPWPARTDASSTIGFVTALNRSIVWLANGQQVPFQYGQEVIRNSSSASGYTVVSPGTNDLWTSSDLGATWDLVTTAAPWSPRTGARMAISDVGTLVMAEGSYDDSNIYDTYPHDVWASADGGRTWGLCSENSTAYSPRRSFGMTIDHSGHLWFSSGQYDMPSTIPLDDLNDILRSEMSFDDPIALQQHCNLTISPCGIGARCYPVTRPCPCLLPSSSSSSTAPIAPSVSSSTAASMSLQGQQLSGAVPLPWGLVYDELGHLYVSEAEANAIAKISTTGLLLANFTFSPALSNPKGLAIDSTGSLYVSDYRNNRVLKFDASGSQQAVFTASQTLSGPSGVAIDAFDYIWVCDTGNNRAVQLFPNDTLGVVVTTTNPAMSYPAGIATDASNSVYIADTYNQRIVKRTISGTIVTFDTFLSNPSAVIVDWTGAMFIADSLHNRIVQISVTGDLINTFSASPSLNYPLGLALNPATGNVYITDYYNNAVVRFPRLSAPVPPTASGSVCIVLYSLPGTVDYPWSVATQLNVVYNPTISTGTAFTLLNATGSRTYTNRFGTMLTTAVTLSPASLNLLYLNSSAPLDSRGLTFELASAIQLPGAGPNMTHTFLNYYFSPSYGLLEGGSFRIDQMGTAFVTSINGVVSTTIGASNINSLAVNYGLCMAPITFINGLRAPTQPSNFNGGTHLAFSYAISDGLTYSVQTNLSLTTSSAFATMKDHLGNPYQTVIAITGTRLYTHLPTDTTLTSHITGMSNVTSDQRFYPYALLSSAPGVYSVDTAPFLDAVGLSFSIIPAAPLNGLPVSADSTMSTTVDVFVNSTSLTIALTEARSSTNEPVASLQKQSYTIL